MRGAARRSASSSPHASARSPGFAGSAGRRTRASPAAPRSSSDERVRATPTRSGPGAPGGGVRFLVTGATGFLGAHVVRALLARGHRVVALVRHGRDAPGRRPLPARPGWLAIGPAAAARATVVAGDVAVERFGLPRHVARACRRRRRGRALRGLDRLRGTAARRARAGQRRRDAPRPSPRRRGGRRLFHLVSSAYAAGSVAGTATVRGGSRPALRQRLRGEQAPRRGAGTRGLRGRRHPAVGLPPGHRVRRLDDGPEPALQRALPPGEDAALPARPRTSTPAARRRGRRGVGHRAAARRRVRMPLRVETHPGAALNLVPVDHFERALPALLDDAPEGGSFPIVSDEAVPVARVDRVHPARYRIEGLTSADASSFAGRPRSALEAALRGLPRPLSPVPAGPAPPRRGRGRPPPRGAPACAAPASPSRSSIGRCATPRRLAWGRAPLRRLLWY